MPVVQLQRRPVPGVARHAHLLVEDAAKLVVVPAVARHVVHLPVQRDGAHHRVAGHKVVKHVVAVVALDNAVQAVAHRRLVGREAQVEGRLAAGQGEAQDVALAILGQGGVLHVNVQSSGGALGVASEHAVRQRHVVLVQHLLQRPLQTRVRVHGHLGVDGLDHLGGVLVHTRPCQPVAGRHVGDAPVQGVAEHLVARSVAALHGAEVAHKQRVLTAS